MGVVTSRLDFMWRAACAVLIFLGLVTQGCIERWVRVDLQSAPPGARVESKGLAAPHGVRDLATPGGHFLRCSVDAVTPEVRVQAESWSYKFTLADHSPEEIFVERANVAKLCADSKKLAMEKPYLVKATLVASSTEKGLTNSVLITTSPAGATVTDDRTGQVLGKTPIRRTWVFHAPYQEEHTLRLELGGYVPIKRIVNVKSIVLHARLYRPGETPPPEPPPKSKQAPRPAGPPAEDPS